MSEVSRPVVAGNDSATGSVPLRWKLALAALGRLPQRSLSRAWGWLADRRWPGWFQARVNRVFAALVGVELEEAEHGPEHYDSLSAFFVRRLRPGLRDWPEVDGVPGSPVDGIVGSFGALADGAAIQAKGISYRVSDLLGDPGEQGFGSGWFITIYLSPRHYHRIHAPLDALVHEARSIPGRLLPVNLPAVRTVSDLFPRNERLVARMETNGVQSALVAVGAYNVGRISAAFDPGWGRGSGMGVTNRPRAEKEGREIEVRRYDPALAVSRGEELMAFHMGSTVVLLLDGSGPGFPGLHPDLVEGQEIRLGTPLLDGALERPGGSLPGRGGIEV